MTHVSSLIAILFVAFTIRGRLETGRAACSLVGIPGIKHVGHPYFLGVATPDSILAGLGATRPRIQRGHYGPSGARETYGQLVAIERTGGSRIAARVARADTVIVVPWDYDSACQPTYWGGSARWLEPGVKYFFYPELREPKHWVRGLPTYDAFYPGADIHPPLSTDLSALQTGVWVRPANSSARAEDVFDFYNAMPDVDRNGEVSGDAFNRIREWAAANPELAVAAPIAGVLDQLAWDAAETRARRIAPPMLGTYRLTVRFPGTSVRVLYLRTANRTDGMFFRPGRDEELPKDPLGFRSLGFNVKFWIAHDEQQLPKTPEMHVQSSWGWHVAWPDSVRANGEWPAEIDPWEFFRRWQDDKIAEFRDARDDWFEENYDRNTLPTWMGAFHGTPDRAFTQHVSAGAAGTLIIEAVRISRTTVPVSNPRR